MGRVAVIGELLIDLISDTQVSELSRAKSFNRFFAGSPGNLVFNLHDLGVIPLSFPESGTTPSRRPTSIFSQRGGSMSHMFNLTEGGTLRS